MPTAETEAARSSLILEGQGQARLHLKFNPSWSYEWGPVQSAVRGIVGAAVKHWGQIPESASKLSTFVILMEVNGAVGRADAASTSFAARKGRLWCTTIAGWPDGDASRRVAMKKWCDAFATTPRPFQVTSYLNNAMPESEAEMLEVFSQDTMKRLRALKAEHDPDNLFKMGAWQYEANK
jgi:hypothetical protein